MTATDADAGATLKFALVGAAPAGLSFKDDGTYSFDASDVAYDSLKFGETKDVVVKFKANDGTVDSAEQALTITVTGKNDAAKITGTSTGSLTEDAVTTTATGSLSVSDADAGQSKAVAQTDTAGTFGKFSIKDTGEWTYTLDNSKAKVQALATDEKMTDTFTVKSADGTASQDVVVTITGVNDAPVASAATKAVDEGATDTGSVTATDADAGATLKFALVGAAPAGLSFKDDGTYSFDAGDAAYDSLKAGETKDVVVKFKANDGTVDSAEQTLTITVTGANDAPTISVQGGDKDTGSTNENDTQEIAGSLTLNDVDADGWTMHGVGVRIGESSTFDYLNQFSAEQQSLLSSKLLNLFTLNAVQNAQLNQKNNQQWSFKSENASDFDFLPVNKTLVVEYVVSVTDAHEESTTHIVSITITGKNDAPVVQLTGNDSDRADLTETNSALSASGTVSLFDMDLTDVVNYVVSDVVLNTTVTSFLSADDFAIIKEQVKGFMTLEAIGYLNDGNNLQWTFDSTGDSHAGFIPGGQTLALDYTVTATDKSGETATHVIHINILGTNATPLIEFKGSDSASESLIETDEVLSTSGTMSLTDLDLNDPSSVTRISVKVNGDDGGFDNDHFLSLLKLAMETDADGKPLRVNDPHNLRWTFESSAKGDFDHLSKDEVLRLDYTIEAKDSHGATSRQVVSIEITGTNDAPLIFANGTDSSEATVDSAFKASGTLTVIDENILTAKVAGVKLFNGADASAAEIDVQGLKLEDMLETSGTFAEVNELHNLTWEFVGDASKANGLASGAYTLAYDIAITDNELISHQTVNIHFQV